MRGAGISQAARGTPDHRAASHGPSAQAPSCLTAQGITKTAEQIISEVWGTSWPGTGRTLEVHMASLRHKLRSPGIIETVRGVGYRLAADRVPCAPA